MKLIKAMITVAGMTGLSRIAGFARDILTANIMGAGPVADAFFVALKLPNLFRRITAEGAFSVSFVPLYTETLTKEGEGGAARFANNAFAIMLWGLSGFTLLMLLAMPLIIYAIAPGFHDDPFRYDLAVTLSRTTFPYLLLISLVSLMGGMLNAHDRFAPFAAAPILFNLSLIGALLYFTPVMETPGHAMAWGVALAGVLQFLLLYYNIRKNGLSIKLIMPCFDKRTKKLFKLMGPGIIGAGVMHINLFADLIIASMLATGSISYLYYADRLNQLPLGLVGIAVGTALLPMLSRAISAGRNDESRNLFSRALEICFLLALPAAVGLFTVSLPIVLTLFEHGEFTRHDSLMTTLVLTAYATGMPAYVAIKVFSTAFWARQDTLTPVMVSIAATLLNIGLSLWLAFSMKLGILGVAVGTATAGWAQFALLGQFLRRHDDIRLDRRFYQSLLKIIAACALMDIWLVLMKAKLFDYYFADNATIQTQILTLAALVGGAVIIYGLAVVFMGIIKPGDLKRLFKRG